MVGRGSYVRRRDPGRAEMAIAVDDAQHGRGIGTALFERLSDDARREGIERFLALVLAQNGPMLRMLAGLGFRQVRHLAGGEVEVEVELRPEPAYVAAADARRHVAATASLEPILRPGSIAVVGASRERGTIGHELFRNLLQGGFEGPVYPVNPKARAVAGVRAYPTVAAIGEPVDLAVVVVPAARVLGVARECLEAGVKGMVVISAGFAEVGDEGRAMQDELLRLPARSLVGPNRMGCSHRPRRTANDLRADAAAGRRVAVARSRARWIAILEHARQLDRSRASSDGQQGRPLVERLLER